MLFVDVFDRQKAASFALGAADLLALDRLRILPDSLDLAAGSRQDVVAVGLRLVAGAFLVGAGALDVVEASSPFGMG